MCRALDCGGRRCPSNRGPRKRAYQRLRYAAGVVEAAHAGAVSPPAGAVELTPAGAVGATALAAAYTPPVPSSKGSRFAAATAVDAKNAAARLNDPNDPLFIDPADTSPSAEVARDAVIKVLASPDLSDTYHLDYMVAAQANRQHREVVVAAAMERAKTVHVLVSEMSDVGVDPEVLSPVVRCTGQAVAVSSGVQLSMAVEDLYRQSIEGDKDLLENTYIGDQFSKRLIAQDPKFLAVFRAGLGDHTVDAEELAAAQAHYVDVVCERNAGLIPDQDSAREAMRNYIQETVPELRREMDAGTFDPEGAVDRMDTIAHSVGVDPARFADMLDEYTAIFPTTDDFYDISNANKGSYDQYVKRCTNEGVEPLTDIGFKRRVLAEHRLMALAGYGRETPRGVDDVDAVVDDIRLNSLADITPMPFVGESDPHERLWQETVREHLNALSPRYVPPSEFRKSLLKNSQARAKHLDEIGSALSMYSQETVERVMEGLERDKQELFIEKSTQRAHFLSWDTREITEKVRSGYGVIDYGELRALATEQAPYVRSIEYLYGSEDGGWDGAFHLGSSFPSSQLDEVTELVEKYNALPVEKRQRLGSMGPKYKKGYRLMVDSSGEGDKKKWFVRSTKAMKESTSTSHKDVSVIRVTDRASTTHHEVAHFVDHYARENNDVAQVFLRERTAGLEERRFGDDEASIADGFYAHYVGKTSYGDMASEVNSMGVEVMFGNPIQHRDTDSLPSKDGRPLVSTAPSVVDPEHHSHTLGVMAGIGGRRIEESSQPEDIAARVDAYNDRVLSFVAKRPELEGEVPVAVPVVRTVDGVDQIAVVDGAAMALVRVPLAKVRKTPVLRRWLEGERDGAVIDDKTGWFQ